MLAMAALTVSAGAQPRTTASPQLEIRLMAALSPSAGALGGIGANVRAGYYARLGIALEAGAVQRADRWESRQRVEGVARFMFDPFAERPRGFYAGAGLGAERRGPSDVRGLLLGVVGMEGRATGRIVPSVELVVGGGTRLGVVLRARRLQGR